MDEKEKVKVIHFSISINGLKYKKTFFASKLSKQKCVRKTQIILSFSKSYVKKIKERTSGLYKQNNVYVIESSC